jgi:hypothetical protein
MIYLTLVKSNSTKLFSLCHESTFEIASYMMNKILKREEITIIQMNEGLDFVIINDSEKHIV